MATSGAEENARPGLRGPGGPPQPPAASRWDIFPWKGAQPALVYCRRHPQGPARGPPPEPRSDWVPPETPPPIVGDSCPPAAPLQRLRLLNTLTGQAQLLEFGGAAERPLQQALPWNAHAGGYVWRWGGVTLNPQRPFPNLDPEPDPDGTPPTVLLYFADDFVEQ